VIAATLAPTTLAGHRFWEAENERGRAQQRVHFLKNLSMLGGLLIYRSGYRREPVARLAWPPRGPVRPPGRGPRGWRRCASARGYLPWQ